MPTLSSSPTTCLAHEPRSTVSSSIAFALFTAADDMDVGPLSMLEAAPPARHPVRKCSPPRHSVDYVTTTDSHRMMGTLSLVAITYFVGGGGLFGSELVVTAAGPLIGLFSLVVYPLLVTVPYAYVLSELCTAFPEDGGFVVWVLNAFGPFWGFQVGYWSWLGGVFSGALLPGLLLKFLLEYCTLNLYGAVPQYFVKVMIALIFGAPAFLGIKAVVRLCLALAGLVLVPIVVFSMWGYAVGHDFDTLTKVRRADTGPIDMDWALLLNTLFWKYDGLAMASVFGGDVAHPTRVYPRALFFTIVLTIVTYLVPLPAAILSQTPHWATYDRTSYPRIALAIGGHVLETLVLFASISGVVGRLLSGLYCQAFQVCGMAENHLLPASLAHRTARCDSPSVAIAATLGAMLLLLSVDFVYLLPVANAFVGATQLLIIAAAARLRIFLPFIPRPTRVPGGVWGLVVVGVLPTAVLGCIVCDAVQTTVTAAFLGVLLVPGVLGGVYQQCRSDAAQSPVMFA